MKPRNVEEINYKETSSLTDFEAKSYFEPEHPLTLRDESIFLHSRLEANGSENLSAPEEHTQLLFKQPIPDMLAIEMYDTLYQQKRAIEIDDAIYLSIPIGFELSNYGTGSFLKWTYPWVKGYMTIDLIDEFSPTFRKAVHLQSLILSGEYLYPQQMVDPKLIADVLEIDKSLVNEAITIKPGIDQNPEIVILKKLLTSTSLPGINLHGRYQNMYPYSKVRTAFITSLVQYIEQFEQLAPYAKEMLAWHRESEPVNRTFRTRYSMLCLDAYLIKILEVIQANPIKRQ